MTRRTLSGQDKETALFGRIEESLLSLYSHERPTREFIKLYYIQ